MARGDSAEMGQRTLEALERTLKHRFRDHALLEQALTHRSLAFEQITKDQTTKDQGGRDAAAATEPEPRRASVDNEKLEYLGDAVLGLLVAESLYRAFPALSEGDLTRMRAALVSRRHLAEVAESLDLGSYLRLGRGEERNGGRQKAVLLANCFEAVLGALYLDAGIVGARKLVEQAVIEPSAGRLYVGLEHGDSMGDHKSALQELVQARGSAPPEYEVRGESGPDHRKRFVVEVVISGSEGLPSLTAQGAGTTKKRAEQEAARIACQQLREHASAATEQAPKSAPA